MNPLIKNCRTGYHNDVQNRTFHYSQLVNSSFAIKNNQPRDYKHILEYSPLQAKLEQQRQATNMRLMNNLLRIDKQATRYPDMIRRKFTMKSQYQQQQKSKSISEGNYRLYVKIKKADSDVSRDKIKQFDNKITKYSQLIKHPLRSVTEMDEELFNTYRQHLFQKKLSHTYRKTFKTQASPEKSQMEVQRLYTEALIQEKDQQIAQIVKRRKRRLKRFKKEDRN